MNETSSTSPIANDSKTSSQTAGSSPAQSTPNGSTSEVEDFLTAPLEGLCPRPMHLMTESELREYVLKVRNHRQSYQSYKAAVEASEAPVLDKVTKSRPKPKANLSEFEDMF
jgi:hypothetical protein